MTADTYITDGITNAVSALDRHLARLIDTAERARADIAAGRRVTTIGTLLGQTPGDVEQAYAALDTLLIVARHAGIDRGAVTDAYKPIGVR